MATSTDMSSTEAQSSSSVSLFKKKKRSRPEPIAANRRVSSNADEGDRGTSGVDASGFNGDEPSSSVVAGKVRKLDSSYPLVSSTGLSLAKRKRLTTREHGIAEEDDGLVFEDEFSSVAPRARAGSVGGGGGPSLCYGNDATRAVDWYDEDGNQGKGAKASDGARDADANNKNDDGMYRGLSSYSSALPQPASRNKHTQRGPIKAPTNIRTVTVVDYQPDVCKDYKETGYCGFGGTCKFLHDRSDYLAGWQMEAAFLPNSSARDLGLSGADQGGDNGNDNDGAGEEEGEEIPFACLICRQPFTDPVATRCGHYFCSSCAVRRFTKTPKCFACGAQTGGIFNSATKVIERMEKRRKAKEDEKQQQRKAWGREDDPAEGAQLLERVEITRGSVDDDE